MSTYHRYDTTQEKYNNVHRITTYFIAERKQATVLHYSFRSAKIVLVHFNGQLLPHIVHSPYSSAALMRALIAARAPTGSMTASTTCPKWHPP